MKLYWRYDAVLEIVNNNYHFEVGRFSEGRKTDNYSGAKVWVFHVNPLLPNFTFLNKNGLTIQCEYDKEDSKPKVEREIFDYLFAKKAWESISVEEN